MAGLSLSYAGLILTHLVSAFIFSFVMAAYLGYRAVRAERKSAVKAFLAIVLGLGVSAYYLIPAAIEQKFVHIHHITDSSVGDYRKNFLFTADKFRDGLRDFYLPLHAAVLLELLLFLVVVSRIKKNGLKNSPNKFFIVTFVLALLLMTPISRPVWELTPGSDLKRG